MGPARRPGPGMEDRGSPASSALPGTMPLADECPPAEPVTRPVSGLCNRPDAHAGGRSTGPWMSDSAGRVIDECAAGPAEPVVEGDAGSAGEQALEEARA